MRFGAYASSFVIQFTREVRLDRFTFEKGETLVLNGNIPGRRTVANVRGALEYVGSLIPAGTYKVVADYQKTKVTA